LTLRVLENIASERHFQADRIRAYHPAPAPVPWLAELGDRFGELCTCTVVGEHATNIRDHVVSIAALCVVWAEAITAELDKATAERTATSAGTVETKPEPKHNLAKYKPGTVWT
jgi:hypothetical protein